MANNWPGVRVWSFDAGGPGTISGQHIVKEIMRRLSLWDKNDRGNPPLPCNYADIKFGAGLGAVAALLLGRLCLCPDDVMEALGTIGEEVFAKEIYMPSEALLSHRPFSTEKLKNVVIEILKKHGYGANTKLIGDAPRNQCKVAVVCARADNAGEVVLLRTYISESARNNHSHADSTMPLRNDESGSVHSNDYTIVDAVLATMATPDWFNPVEIGSDHNARTFIGAPMKTHNPINEALKELRRIYRGYSVGSIISIGNGHHGVHRLEQSNKDGFNEMSLKMMHDCDVTAEEANDRFLQHSEYQRLSVPKGMDNIGIRDWDDDHFGKIATQTMSYIRTADVNKALNIVVSNLRGSPGYQPPTVAEITSWFQVDRDEGLPPYSPHSRYWQVYSNSDNGTSAGPSGLHRHVTRPSSPTITK